MEEIDLWRAAKLLVDQHGEDAIVEASARANELMKAGDLEGHAVWKRIIGYCAALIDEERPDDAVVN